MITRLKYGNTNTFLLKGDRGSILIDTDYAGSLTLFYKAIKEKDVKVENITYVLPTHYHPDHMGIVSELMEQGVQLILMESQREYVHFSDKIFEKEFGSRYRTIDEYKAVPLSFADSRVFLKRLGLNGEVIPTPSHSPDSISIILNDGNCFVGDLEPFSFIEAYDENEALKLDWDRIMSYNPKVIHYAHANEKVIN